jgi:hypothetical protein
MKQTKTFLNIVPPLLPILKAGYLQESGDLCTIRGDKENAKPAPTRIFVLTSIDQTVRGTYQRNG